MPRNSIRRREERVAAYDIAKEMLKNPKLRHKLIRRHPRLNVQVVIEEEQEKEVFDVSSEKNNPTWNPEEALKILDSLYGKALENGEDTQELDDIANRKYKWRSNDIE